jgi:hypothetical protein
MIDTDIKIYYALIITIFFIVKSLLFCTLWSWLKIKVTHRLEELTKSLENPDQRGNRRMNLSEIKPAIKRGSQRFDPATLS